VGVPSDGTPLPILTPCCPFYLFSLEHCTSCNLKICQKGVLLICFFFRLLAGVACNLYYNLAIHFGQIRQKKYVFASAFSFGFGIWFSVFHKLRRPLTFSRGSEAAIRQLKNQIEKNKKLLNRRQQLQ